MATEFPEPAVLNWHSVIHKSVRTRDGEPLGYIAADDKESIIVLSSRFREYRIPKSEVTGFDGSVVRVNPEYVEMDRYKIG